jgi:hypothetical protein
MGIHIAGSCVSNRLFLASNAATEVAMRRSELMKREDVMRADLFSEIVLLVSGVAIVIALVMVLVASLTSAAAAQ